MLEKNEIIQSVLRNLRIEELNPMQEASLEQATGKKDVILLSPTGSGKTLAYLLPLLLTLKTDDGSVQVHRARGSRAHGLRAHGAAPRQLHRGLRPPRQF